MVDARTGIVRNFEALVLWDHPQRDMVSPDDFISLAEQTGRIISIDQWVLHQACLEVQREREETGLDPYLLDLEVTEGVVMSGADKAIEPLKALHHLAMLVAVDDFGTDFSSPSYLRKLPISKVKRDRSFAQSIDHNQDNAAIVQGVTTMVHHLGLQVAAEGLDTLAEHEDLIKFPPYAHH